MVFYLYPFEEECILFGMIFWKNFLVDAVLLFNGIVPRYGAQIRIRVDEVLHLVSLFAIVAAFISLRSLSSNWSSLFRAFHLVDRRRVS